jgi:hypothetical protein
MEIRKTPPKAKSHAKPDHVLGLDVGLDFDLFFWFCVLLQFAHDEILRIDKCAPEENNKKTKESIQATEQGCKGARTPYGEDKTFRETQTSKEDERGFDTCLKLWPDLAPTRRRQGPDQKADKNFRPQAVQKKRPIVYCHVNSSYASRGSLHTSSSFSYCYSPTCGPRHSHWYSPWYSPRGRRGKYGRSNSWRPSRTHGAVGKAAGHS